MGNSSAITRGIHVDVHSQFLPEQSSPGQWVFAYQITISNHSEETVQLVSRFWEISNANGRIEHVRGPGVVGHQPTLRPGEAFQYVSGCPLDTPFGSMKGTYQMMQESGEAFDVAIAEFALVDPASLN